MNTSSNALADLRDIHLPQPLSLWPLAPGWYILAGLLLMTTIALGIYFIYHYRKMRIKRYALTLIRHYQEQGKTEPRVAADGLAALLKRVAKIFFPEQETAHLYGESWLAFLDKTGRTKEFSEGSGRYFANCHYQAQEPENIDELCRTTKIWIKRIK